MKSSTSWLLSAGWQETSSGGSLLPTSEQLSLLPAKRFDTIGITGAYVVELNALIDGTERQVAFRSHDDGEYALKRVMCGFMLASIPETGLDEAFQCLQDVLEFHSYRPSALVVTLPVRATQGKVVGEKMRPDLILSD